MIIPAISSTFMVEPLAEPGRFGKEWLDVLLGH